jgi:UDP-N-acetylmuramyl pentapeptide synthase
VIPLAAGELEGTRLLSGDPATRIESVVSDSRAAGPGALFCALEGARSDGHDFLDDVRAAGAVAVLCRAGRARPLAGGCGLEASRL